jgi:hypothetical protein
MRRQGKKLFLFNPPQIVSIYVVAVFLKKRRLQFLHFQDEPAELQIPRLRSG